VGALLDIRDLKVRFGAVVAVRGVSLSVDEGEVLGLVGESDTGKSATALAVMGILPPTATVAGQILWPGAGEAVESGDSGRLLTKPEHAYTRTLLAAVPTLHTDRAQALAVAGT
jgi:ABC-type dipeptide/oligopeptide/nickel transport system ATPase component